MSQRLSALSEEAALEQLHADGCTDGLPVVVPTLARVERMVLASGLDADASLGQLGPNLGEATVEKAAIAAVMAGCLPDYFPVVVAAVRAVSDPRMDMTEVQATTHNLGPMLIVNGPAVGACGIASGFGALGPGHRANATIGRAVRLAMINIGGGRPGTSDMALLGHPGKFTFCLGEDEEASPWPPLHTSLGYDIDQSTVTVVCTEGPHSVVCFPDDDPEVYADHLLNALAASLSGLGANNTHFAKGSQVVVLNPDHATALADVGYDRDSIAEVLCQRAKRTWAELSTVRTQGSGINDEQRRQGGDPDKVVHALRGPEALLILVAGGTGLYSTVMPSWGAGPHGNGHLTVEIDMDQTCEVPLVVAGG
jgi:hypothetical protein